MTFGEVMNLLHARGIEATEPQIRWAIRTGKVRRPRVDGSLRFDFSQNNIDDLVRLFVNRKAINERDSVVPTNK